MSDVIAEARYLKLTDFSNRLFVNVYIFMLLSLNMDIKGEITFYCIKILFIPLSKLVSVLKK